MIIYVRLVISEYKGKVLNNMLLLRLLILEL